MRTKNDSAHAWAELSEALRRHQPDCEDDPRYIADLNQNGDIRVMEQICTHCPLLEQCMDYALTEKPTGGWWPGRQLKNIGRKAA